MDATISYNIQGPKLVIAGSAGRADVYELERNLIDIKLSKKLGKHFGLSLKIRDLLGNPVIRSYKFRNGWIDFDRYRFGSTYQFSLSYNIN
jgi:hypothetical protein